MNLPRLGHAVIVNNVASEMQGSQKDVAALKAAYETIGFDVRVYNDCSAQVFYFKKYDQHLVWISVSDPGFSGARTYHLATISWKLHENEDNWADRGGVKSEIRLRRPATLFHQTV